MMRVVFFQRPTNDPDADDAEFATANELRRWSQGRRLWAVLQILLSFVEGVLEAAILTLVARLALSAVDAQEATVYVPAMGDQSISLALILLVTMIFIRLVAGLTNTFMSNRLQFALMRAIRHEAISAYAASSWSAQSRYDDGAIQQLIVAIPNGISGQLAGLITHLGQISIMIAMLGYSMFTDVRLTLILVLIIISSTIIFRPLRTLIKAFSSRALAHQRDLSSYVAQLVGIRFEAQTFGLTRKAADPLYKIVEAEANQSERLGRLKGSVVPVFTTVTYLAVAFSIVVLVRTDSSNLAKTGPILLVVLRSLSYGTAIQQTASGIATLSPSLQLVRDRIRELEGSRVAWGDRQFDRFRSCQLVHAEFTYPGEGRPAVRGATIDITRGMRVGILGPSGSGKSTMVRLLLGLVVPQAGEVRVNEVPLHSFDRRSWSARIGVVPQTAQVLAGTIGHNLRFFRDGISDADLWAALEIADLVGEVAAMPDGLGTVIGPGHRSLSGGQQQRLSIARAFAARPDFVVMDEPTSSIDALSEAAIAEALERIPDDVTLVIVSHRLRILQYCDQIAIVEKGHFSHVGTPTEVRSRSKYLQSITPQ